MKPTLVIPPRLRDDKDIDILEKCTSHLSFFEQLRRDESVSGNIGNPVHRAACRELIYQDFAKGEKIFAIGTLGSPQMTLLRTSTSC